MSIVTDNYQYHYNDRWRNGEKNGAQETLRNGL